MKELSIEEKAKRYNEAIERARQIHDADRVSGIELTTCEEIFPELKESEDENWIPKEIMKYLKEKGDFRSCWIAWLEKQGEQKPTIEMKSAEESLGIDSETYNKIVDECIYGDDKQKPAWSEEDEVNLTNIFLLIKEDASLHFIKDDITKGVAWLESLKGRVQPQNHWKPSKEQMQTLLSEVEGWVKGCPKQKVLESLYNDLKKLTEE